MRHNNILSNQKRIKERRERCLKGWASKCFYQSNLQLKMLIVSALGEFQKLCLTKKEHFFLTALSSKVRI